MKLTLRGFSSPTWWRNGLRRCLLLRRLRRITAVGRGHANTIRKMITPPVPVTLPHKYRCFPESEHFSYNMTLLLKIPLCIAITNQESHRAPSQYSAHPTHGLDLDSNCFLVTGEQLLHTVNTPNHIRSIQNTGSWQTQCVDQMTWLFWFSAILSTEFLEIFPPVEIFPPLVSGDSEIQGFFHCKL